MTCIPRIRRQMLASLSLAALLAAPLAAGDVRAQSRAASAVHDNDRTDLFWAPWRALHDLIQRIVAADGTGEPPPPPPPPPPPEGEDGELKPPICPAGQTTGPCTDPSG